MKSERAKKSLGQNFLINPRIRQRIIQACELSKDDVVLEIGPGKGALTCAIAPCVKAVFAIEKDDRLAQRLQEQFSGTNVTVIHADVLKYPFDLLPDGMKVIGNLPYNITTPIIEKIFQHQWKFPVFYMTVQLEYGNRMIAGPDSKNYGSLSCFVQYHADAKRIFRIPNTAFRPVPKVQSCFICLRIRKKPEYSVDADLLFKVIRACFNQRRKIIMNSLARVIPKEKLAGVLHAAGIDPCVRAEELGLADYARLTGKIKDFDGESLG